MDLLITVILLLVFLLISNIISHYIPFIPTALTQITFGIILALLFEDFTLEIETEWFLLLFVAPLLFNDGRHFSREELWKLRAPILGNAVVLVLLTTIAGGYFIHWMIRDIPLAAAFALAAILSPTDPVAVNGIAKRIHIPEKILNLVRGESLINDASGLVAFNYAVAAVVTGYFSLKEALFDFTYMFIAGAILGVLLGLFVTWVRYILRKQGINDVTFHSLLQILTPFMIFMITEELLHASGVIAVVVAGIIHSLVKERSETIVAEEQVLTENIWSIVLFVLNGIVFLLLGLVIPSSMKETVANPNIGNWLLIGYVIAIGLAILGIRFVWTYIFSFIEYQFGENRRIPDISTTLLTSLTGVRGAVTMAGVLSIPYVLLSGAVFPERSLIIFLAAGVILFTLIMATIFLPILSKDETKDSVDLNDLSLALRAILAAAIEKIKVEMNEENQSAAYELMHEYRTKFQKMQPFSDEKNTIEYQQRIVEVRLLGLREERQYLQGLLENQEVDASIFEVFQSSLDYREEALSKSIRSRTIYLIRKMHRGLRKFRKVNRHHSDDTKAAKIRLGREIQLKAAQAAHDKLKKYAMEREDSDIIYEVVLDYKRLINRLKIPAAPFSEKSEEQKEELRIIVMDTQRSKIHEMYESGEITREQARDLRKYINFIEIMTLHEHVE